MKSERKRVKRIWIGAIVLFLALVGAYAFSVYYKLQQTTINYNKRSAKYTNLFNVNIQRNAQRSYHLQSNNRSRFCLLG